MPTRTVLGATFPGIALACVLVMLVGAGAEIFCQTLPPVPPAGEKLPPPRLLPGPAPQAPSPDAATGPVPAGPEVAGVPITLLAALRLAQNTNWDIAQAREVVNRARADLAAARVAALPNLGIGSTYSHHEGNIQKTEGNVLKANKDALFVGGGPAAIFQTTDVLFGPLVARQVAAATRAGLQRVNNDTLLAVADAYFNVLRARRRLARVVETLTFLTADRLPIEGEQFKGLLPLVRDHVEVGAQAALKSELARVQVEILRRQEEQRGALEDLQVATAELARLLAIDPRTPLVPVEDFRFPIPIPGGQWSDRPINDLVLFALSNRPELAENQALVQAALARVQAARFRPYLPNVALGYNWGGFGGGPDANPDLILPPARPGGKPMMVSQPGFGPSGRILHFDTRTDFDVALFWRLQNLGFGNRAERRGQQAAYRQSVYRRAQVQDQVVAQVVQAQEQVLGWRERMEITRSALFDFQGKPNGPVFDSLRLNFARIMGVLGTRPLEVLDSIRGLSDILEAYGQAVTDYERSQFRLLIALGVPPQAFLDPRAIDSVPKPANANGCPNR